MGKALYRTYRSKKLSEIVGQEHITTALEHALTQGTICHAYLFTGPRGIGKTSIARILAHEINGLPYDEDRPHLDIIEIDAASNRRIDEIRDLRDKVHNAPSSAKFKVYIIDEVHMLTKEAFNALLKTLEEPPEHVIFILATTEVHKLPETIVSRTQRYAFKPVDLPQVVTHLRYIAKQEGIDITDEALGLIAAHGEGSFRDSISLLDQARNAGAKIDLQDVQTMLGIAPAELIASLMQDLYAHNSTAIAAGLSQMHMQGYEPTQIARQLGAVFRESVIAGDSPLEHAHAMRLLEQLVQVPASPDPRTALEIALLDAALSASPTTTQRAGEGQGASHSSPTKRHHAPAAKPDATPKVMPEETPPSPAIQIDPKKEPLPQPAAPSPAVDDGMILTNEAWDLVLNAIKQKYNTLYSVAKMAQPHFEPGHIVLEFSYAFHQKRLNDKRNKQILGEVIASVTGSNVQISCTVGTGRPLQPATANPPLPPAEGEIVHNITAAVDTGKPQPESVAAISNIFGGAELLES